MPQGLTLRGKAVPAWFQTPGLRLPFSTWWHQALWARGVLRPVGAASGHTPAVLNDVLNWAEQAVHAPWCRQDVGHALKAWALDVHHQRLKTAWEHAADLEALMTLVRPDVDDPRLLRWAHPDAVWSAWERWEQPQRERAGRWMALQASALMVMAEWWRRACAPDDRPGDWYGVPNPWSLTTQPGWVLRWGDRVNRIVQTVMLDAHHWSRAHRMHWVRWMDRMLFETWPSQGLDDSDLLQVACAWHNWVKRQPWRAERAVPTTSPLLQPPDTWLATQVAAGHPTASLPLNAVSGVAPVMTTPAIAPSPPALPAPASLPWITVPVDSWGSAGFAPIVDAMSPSAWPQDTTLWWHHRKGERTPATEAWNVLWSPAADRHAKARAMLLLSDAYGHGLHGLRTSLRLRDRWQALFEQARRPSLEWIAADWKTAKTVLRWDVSPTEDECLVALSGDLGALESHEAWCAWLGWDDTLLQPRSSSWTNAWRAHRTVLRQGRTLLRGPGGEGQAVWKQRWTVWIDAILAWETTLSKLPTVGDAWAHQFRERITRRMMAHADALPRLESWESMDAWLGGDTKPFAVWEMALLRPAHVSTGGTVKVLAQEPVLDRTKEADLRIIVDRCAALWSPGCQVLPTPPDSDRLSMGLNEEFPWFATVTQRLTRRLAMRHALGSSFRLPTLLLVGAPGIGKTSYLRALAQGVGVPFGVLGLNGMTDNRLLAGTARGYSNMRPGWPVEFVARERCANPLLVLDEIDKVAQGQQSGRVWDTLLGLTEPGSARAWFDECLLTPVDLSGVSWLATANSMEGMPAALLSRFEVISVDAPDWSQASHREAALRRIRRDLATEWGCENLDRMPWLTAAHENSLWAHNWTSLRHLTRAVENVVESLVLTRSQPEPSAPALPAPFATVPLTPVVPDAGGAPNGSPPGATGEESPWHRWAHHGPDGS